MNVRLALAGLGLPPFVRRRGIRRLFRITAEAFAAPLPPRLSPGTDRLLEEYATFTRDETGRLASRPADVEGVREGLRTRAKALGADLGRAFGVKTRRDGERLLSIVYQAIGIDLSAEGGAVTVGRCGFAPFYDEETCRMISALDEGLMAGILGEGRLEFAERLTAGRGRCAGTFRSREDRP